MKRAPRSWRWRSALPAAGFGRFMPAAARARSRSRFARSSGRADRGPRRLAGADRARGPARQRRAARRRATGSRSSSTTTSPASASAATMRSRASGGRCARAIGWSTRRAGTVLLDATAGSDAGIDVVGSEYATVAAEQTALERLSEEVADQIVARVALYASRGGAAPVKANRRADRAGARSARRHPLLPASTVPTKPASRALRQVARRRRSGADAERIDLSGAELKADPARLADEAASISLFGGARYILVEPAGDEIIAGGRSAARGAGGRQSGRDRRRRAQAGLEAAQAGPGRRRPRSPSPATCPKAREADRLVLDWRAAHGLIVRPDVARRIADGCGGNRAIIAQELAKYALYLDASPEAPQAARP